MKSVERREKDCWAVRLLDYWAPKLVGACAVSSLLTRNRKINPGVVDICSYDTINSLI